MSGANEMSLIAGRACGARVVWGLRHSDITIVRQTLVDRWMSHAGALLSRQSDRIIANSQMGRSFHIAGGYCEARITVIPNGIDTETFSILPRQREAVRREWNVASDQILIGRAARLDPLKDYPSFLRAAAIVSRRHPGAKFACIGDGTDCEQLRQMALEVGIGHRMIWAGGRADMSAVYNALDICVSSSLSEGFPNAVAEPMACGTPCVVTDVGDSAVVVGTAGVIVPAGDPAALADGLGEVIANWQQYPRERVRRQIMDNFSLERLVASTEAEFVRLLRPMASLADSGPW
jgi:glycosyltransferase involved in cell wall biosynthesis